MVTVFWMLHLHQNKWIPPTTSILIKGLQHHPLPDTNVMHFFISLSAELGVNAFTIGAGIKTCSEMKTRCISEYLDLALTLMHLFLLDNHSLLPDFDLCNIATCDESWVLNSSALLSSLFFLPTTSTFCNRPRYIDLWGPSWPSDRNVYI